MRADLAVDVEKSNERAQQLAKELELARTTIRDANERVVNSEGELRQLKSMLDHERSNSAELVEMARQNGEMDALRHRLNEQSMDHGRALEEAEVKIVVLEEEIRAGESARRKMHNTIQGLHVYSKKMCV